MGAGASLLQDELTRDEAKALVGESKWDDDWDDRYFAEGQRVARELAERVWNDKYPRLRGGAHLPGVEALNFSAIVDEKHLLALTYLKAEGCVSVQELVEYEVCA